MSELVNHRLARLGPETGAVLEVAAVVGRVFELRVIAAAAGADPGSLSALLERATAGGMIEELPGPVIAHRFTHELIRRAVYDRLSNERRARLHLQVGEAIEQAHASDLDQVLSELAHHFGLAAPVAGPDRAVVYELRAADQVLLSFAALKEAAAHLERALELGVADDRLRTCVQIDLGWLLAETGRVKPAASVLQDALASATKLDEPGLAAYAAVFLARWGRIDLPRRPIPEMQTTARDAIATFEKIDDRRGVAIARHLLGCSYRGLGQGAAGMAEMERALADAEASNHPPTRSSAIGQILQFLYFGPTPVGSAIARCDELRQSMRDEPVLEAMTERLLALFLAMSARFGQASETERHASMILDQLDDRNVVILRVYGARTHRLLGDPAAAEQDYLAVWRRFADGPDGAPRQQASLAARGLADLHCSEGRWVEAADWLRRAVSRHETPFGDYARLALTARIAAHGIEIDDGLARASHTALEGAVGILCPEEESAGRTELRDWRAQLRRGLMAAERTDFLTWRAQHWLALAEVERADGRLGEAERATVAALALFERKGDLADAAAVREAHRGGRPD